MLLSLIAGGALGFFAFLGFVRTPWMPYFCSIIHIIYEILFGQSYLWSLVYVWCVFILLFIASGLLYHPFGTPVSIWSSMWMRDDQWKTVINSSSIIDLIGQTLEQSLNSLKELFRTIIDHSHNTIQKQFNKTKHSNKNKSDSDSGSNDINLNDFNIGRDNSSDISVNSSINGVTQHVYVIICKVSHLPAKDHLSRVMSDVLDHYPQLCNLPIIGDAMKECSFTTVYETNLDDHIYEFRLKKDKMDNIDSLMCNKIGMNLNQPWWDVFLITPEVENDERALDPQFSQLSIVIFRFHQAIIDLPTIEQFLNDLSNQFNVESECSSDSQSGSYEDDTFHHSPIHHNNANFQNSDINLHGILQQQHMNVSDNKEALLRQRHQARATSQPTLTPRDMSALSPNNKEMDEQSQSNPQIAALLNREEKNGNSNNEYNDSGDGSTSQSSAMTDQDIQVLSGNVHSIKERLLYVKMQLINGWTWLRAGFLVFKLVFLNKSNVFNKQSHFDGFEVIHETFEDTGLRKVMRQAKAELKQVGRACIAGAIIRYFEDNNNSSSNIAGNENNGNENVSGNNNNNGNGRNGNNLECGRFLESFDLSQNETVMDETSSDMISRDSGDGVPIFKELIGYSSIGLAISDDITHPRARLLSITNSSPNIFDQNKYDEYRIAWWINQLFKGLSFVLPDLLCKNLMSSLINHHSLEICYLSFENNDLMIGNEPCEELRIVKTNMNTSCLCISTYSGDISLNFTYNPHCVNNPQRLIQGFLAEMEELQAMFHQ